MLQVEYGRLAQRLAQGTHNPLVLGSNPRAPTLLSTCADVFFIGISVIIFTGTREYLLGQHLY